MIASIVCIVYFVHRSVVSVAGFTDEESGLFENGGGSVTVSARKGSANAQHTPVAQLHNCAIEPYCTIEYDCTVYI